MKCTGAGGPPGQATGSGAIDTRYRRGRAGALPGHTEKTTGADDVEPGQVIDLKNSHIFFDLANPAPVPRLPRNKKEAPEVKVLRACAYLRVSTANKTKRGESSRFDQEPAVQEQPLR